MHAGASCGSEVRGLEHVDTPTKRFGLLERFHPPVRAELDAHDGAGGNLDGGDGFAAGTVAGTHAGGGAVAGAGELLDGGGVGRELSLIHI